MIRFEGAENALVHFNLNRRMANAKMLVQLMSELDEKLITRIDRPASDNDSFTAVSVVLIGQTCRS